MLLSPSCTDATYLPGMVLTTFKARNLPSSYCPLGGSKSGALGSDADWHPEDWNAQVSGRRQDGAG